MSNVEEQNGKCDDCKYYNCSIFEDPCRECLVYKGVSKWEKKEKNEDE